MEAATSAHALWWVLSIGLIVVGIAGTVLPALPGTILVFAGILLGAWIDDFTRVSGWTVLAIALLAAAAFAVDYVAALLGAQRAGASRLALVGAGLGTLAGIFTGLWGLVFMPLLGAVAGELIAQRRARAGAGAGAATVLGPDGSVVLGPATAAQAGQHAARVGLATWVGMLVGTVAKLALVFAMLGVFALALMIG